MKFDELFNKIMDKLDVVNEEAEDVYDPESAGENTEDTYDKVAKDLTDIPKLASAQPNVLGLGPVEEDEGQINKELAELEKIKVASMESEKENRIATLINLIKQSEDNIERYKIIQNKSIKPEILAQCNDFLQNEIPRLEQFKNELLVLKPKKVKNTSSDSSKSTEPKKSEEKETPKENKKEDKKEEKSDDKKEEKKEDKEPKKESVEPIEDSKPILTEAKKPVGTEFYLTEMNK